MENTKSNLSVESDIIKGSNLHHFVEIDHLRCFAILAVIFDHATSALPQTLEPTDLLPLIIIRRFGHFVLPLFVCISGFVLNHSYKSFANPLSFYKHRYLRIIPPYLIFTVVYIAANIFRTKVITGNILLPSVSDIVMAFVFAESNDHMWFLLIIIELYLIFPVLHWIYSRIHSGYRETIFLLSSFVIQKYWEITSSGIYFDAGGVSHSLLTKIFLSVFFYFVLGMCLSRHYKQFRILLSTKSVGALTLIFIIITVYLSGNKLFTPGDYSFAIQNYVYSILAILLLFSFGIYLVESDKFKLSVLIGSYSFGIYLIHPLLQGLLGYIVFPIMSITRGTVFYYMLLFVTSAVLSIICIYFIKKFPYHKYIIG